MLLIGFTALECYQSTGDEKIPPGTYSQLWSWLLEQFRDLNVQYPKVRYFKVRHLKVRHLKIITAL